MNILIPMAGRGSRTKDFSDLPKPLILLHNKPMIQWAVETLNLSGQYIFVVRNYNNNKWNSFLKNILESCVKNPIIISIDYITEGPASSALLAKEYINNDEELVIANSDQILEWNSKDFLKSVSRNNIDGLVVTWDKIEKTESFIELNEKGYGIRLKEKEIISNYPLNGIHYWKKGKYFVSSTEEMIRKNIRSSNNEFYVSESYNFLINKGLRIGHYPITGEQHWPIGMKNDIQKYLNKNNKNK